MNNEEPMAVTLRVINLRQPSSTERGNLIAKLRLTMPRLLMLLIVVGASYTLLSLILAVTGNTNRLAWLLQCGLAFLITLALVPVTERFVEIRNQHLYQPEGEKALLTTLKPFFDPRWALLQHVPLAQTKQTIDAVLVGPTGLYVLEIIGHPGYNQVSGERWYRWRWGIWFPVFNNPTEQLKQKSAALKHNLSSAGIDALLEPRVVWSGPGHLTVEASSIEVWKLADIELAIEALKRFKLLRQGQVESIVKCLAGEAGATP